jgi:tryptophan-rich sensory protein
MAQPRNAWYVVIPIVLACVANGIVYRVRTQEELTRNPRLPPGWVIGAVWVMLFGMLGHVAYLVRTHRGLLVLIGFIFAYYLAYPFTTTPEPQMLNVGALLLAAALVCALIAQRRTHAAIWSLPLLAWCAYVNVVAVD